MVFKSNQELVNYLKERGVLRTKEIIDAFLKIDRKDFVKEEYIDQAYFDTPLPTLMGQTISQPYVVAFMLELLQPQKGQKILDIGFGSGWTTSLLAEITQTDADYTQTYADNIYPNDYRINYPNKKPNNKTFDQNSGNKFCSDSGNSLSPRESASSPRRSASGKVYGIEVVPEVFEFGKKNIGKYNFLQRGIVEVFLMDGSKGFPEKAPFDRILVSAASKKIPEEMILQLKDGGILVIPDFEGIWKVKKINGKIEKEYHYGFIFVPLVEK
jgi:protein-L-isoaspartate O-methyltransferase